MHRPLYSLISSIAVALLVTSPALAIVSSNTGININQFLGAERFYDAGYTGTRTIQANIEAGHIWNGHSTLEHATTRVTGSGALGTDDSHATRVGAAMGGRSTSSEYPNSPSHWGIAYDADLWSGAIATSFGDGISFSATNGSIASTYRTILQTGVNGQTADVFNSSWSFDDPLGNQVRARGIDGLINNNGTVGVFAAGNGGPDPNTVGGVGAGYNSITVAALRQDNDATPYNRLSNFSARGPNDFAMATSPTNYTTIPGVRAAVDIAAPGQNLTLANLNAQSNPNHFSTNQAGTSFAAPLVAGGASLIVDAGKDLYTGNSNAIDGRVVKAVLLNSADKIGGWNNGQIDVGGVIQTTQSLDWGSGAGRMNLDRAFDQYIDAAAGGMAGTTDVPGLASGDVAPVGWDFGWVDAFTSNTYFIDQPLVAGSTFTSTLTWFADRNAGDSGPGNPNLINFSGASEQHLANLDLSIFHFDDLENRNILGTIAESISLYNVVEHLSFTTPETGFYGIEVTYTGNHWNFTGETGEHFGLAWWSTPLVVLAGERFWSNPAGGFFGTPDNWDPAATPEEEDTAVFNLTSSYTVEFAANFTNHRLQIGNDHVTFALAGFTYELTSNSPAEHSITIGSTVGDNAQLTLTGGTLLGVTASLGETSGSSGKVVVGAGANWTNSGELTIGHGGTGTLTVADAGTVSNTYAEIGSLSAAAGEVTVTGAGSAWNNGAHLVVGVFGSGTLTIEAGGTVSNTTGTIASDIDSTGTATVTGIDSAWTNSAELIIGHGGTGTLTVADAGSVANTFAEIGSLDTAVGEVTVTSAGSAWNNGAHLVVGAFGSGTLTVEASGNVSNTSGSIASEANSIGTVTVTGIDSAWTNSDELTIGHGGTGTLTIADAASVSNTFAEIGSLDTAAGEVTVTGTGSEWNNIAHLIVGAFGTGTLGIEAAGFVTNTNGTIAREINSTGTVTVAGANSEWHNSGDLVVGAFGSGTLIVEAGGIVINTIGTIGSEIDSTGTVTLTGSDSVWTSSAELYIGHGGTGTLTIEEAGSVANTFAEIGSLANGTGNVTVTGVGSEWNNSDELAIGVLGSGTLTIESGGTVSNTSSRIASGIDSAGLATVTGEGSKWHNSAELHIGYGGTGTLFIEESAEVFNTFAEIGSFNTATGHVAVTSGSTWSNSGDLVIGAFGSGSLTVESGGIVTNTTASIASVNGSFGTVTVTGAGSLWHSDNSLYVGGYSLQAGGEGLLNIGDNGTVVVTNTLKTWDSGTVNLNGGNLHAPSLDLTEGTLNMTAGRLVTQNVLGNLTVDGGTFALGDSPSSATITGDYFQSPDATLELLIGGLNSGFEFDVLSIDGTATLAGILDVSLFADFLPSGGELFEILTAASIVDNGLVLGGSAASLFDLVVDDFSVTLQAINFAIPGDFNGDGVVDTDDLPIWETSFAVDLLADADGDGFTDGADFLIWQRQFGTTNLSAAVSTAVPEPNTMVLLLAATFSLFGGLARRI